MGRSYLRVGSHHNGILGSVPWRAYGLGPILDDGRDDSGVACFAPGVAAFVARVADDRSMPTGASIQRIIGIFRCAKDGAAELDVVPLCHYPGTWDVNGQAPLSVSVYPSFSTPFVSFGVNDDPAHANWTRERLFSAAFGLWVVTKNYPAGGLYLSELALDVEWD